MLLVTQLLIGSAIGLVITTTGVGGGVILLPVLIYLFGMNALAAVATANLLSMLMKISSSYIHFTCAYLFIWNECISSSGDR
ncbi:TSUP family transporter [Proteus sp. G2675]|uniref:TSUP family transporter n=1 Tax=Proteus sp. G2675 TaxID=2698887 RepID=UPI001376EFED|nr:TSUP family transporter [Proteus sp. G2675]NBL92338.1 TSUP family transporter [Proteus sp. G2675]